MVDGVLPFQDDFRNGNEGVTFLQKTLDNIRQGLRSVQRGVVEQNNGAGTHLARHSLGDVRGAQILPIQAVTIPYNGKSLGNARSPIYHTVWHRMKTPSDFEARRRFSNI